MAEHFGLCNQCNKLSPARYEERDGRVLFVKDCAACGRTETIVSSDPAVWRAKRDVDRVGEVAGCALNCAACGVKHTPTTVFVEVTNRCNQKCPICIASVAHMGFRFDPPLAYFEKVFQHLAGLNPKPSIKLFGGEPTVREDLEEIITCARKLGLSTSIVTNGLRFADEDYARRILATRAKLVFAFDGRDPKVYEVFRGDAKCYEKKLKALENVRKHRKSKITLMCVVAQGINDHLIADLLEYCRERADFINALEFIPLTRVWPAGAIEADGHEITAMEDVEKILGAAVEGGTLEFLPAGLNPFKTFAKYLPIPRLTFAGAHPNCESISFLIADDHAFHPVSAFLKGGSLYDVVHRVVDLDAQLGARMERIERGVWGRLGLARLIGRVLAVRSLAGVMRQSTNLQAIFGAHAGWKITKVVAGIILGRKPKTMLRANTRLRNVLRVVVLPFEEPRTLDSARLVRCPAAFAYEDPDTRAVRTVPVCAWGLYRDDILRRTMEHYAPAARPVAAV